MDEDKSQVNALDVFTAEDVTDIIWKQGIVASSAFEYISKNFQFFQFFSKSFFITFPKLSCIVSSCPP